MGWQACSWVVVVWGLSLGALGCESPSAAQPPSARTQVRPLSLESSAFNQHGEIPSRHTCEGENLSPPLAWSRTPEGTQSLALVVDRPEGADPDAPQLPRVHWILFDIPPIAQGLNEGADPLPPGTRRGLNDFGQTDYRGPCPTRGRHRYVHRIYALDAELELERPDRNTLQAAMEGHVLAEAQLIGTYRRKQPQPDRVARRPGTSNP